MEENMKQNIEQSAKQIVNDVLEAAVRTKTERDTISPTERQPSLNKSDSDELNEIPPLVPDSSEEERLIEELKSRSPEQKKTSIEKQLDEPPKRPPRHSDIHRLHQSQEDIFIPTQIIENSHNVLLLGDTPPPRPPDPEERLYLRSQPPPSFYVLRSPALDNFIDEDIPMPPRRKRPPRPPSQSSSEEALPATPRSRRHRTPEPSIPQLTEQLTKACVTASEKALKRLVKHVTMNVLRNADGQQDLHVIVFILLILIAGLILLGNGGSPVVHHYHWEYFNPPRDL
ncbi:hypothetical protein AMK59_5872 [Oryctes borbonicus]|uniref:Uncharacterized protein n=1 Tax=Oryctes borbonicus TaxID=1629725 RepID=A0A0T6B2E2_9SCAR|nr:hypothetical protein AMK59_5872 [Oryctes borbonicus]